MQNQNKMIIFKYDQKASHFSNLKNLIKGGYTKAEVLQWHRSNFPQNKKGELMVESIYNSISNRLHLWDPSMSVLANIRIIENRNELIQSDTLTEIVEDLLEKYPFVNKQEIEKALAQIF